MKGIGEVGTNGPLPAIAGAVEDALAHVLTVRPARRDGCSHVESAPGEGRMPIYDMIQFVLNGQETAGRCSS